MHSNLEVLRGGVAVVTGAASGIGEGLARYAGENGMKLVIADINEERLNAIAEELRSKDVEVLAVPTDVSDAVAIDRLADAAFDHYGEVRLLINNAGIETLGFVWELPADVWDKTLNINIHGAVHGVRAFAPRMLASGKPGFIANTASIGGFGTMPVQTSYIMSKHAMIAFSECLAMEMQVKQAPIQVSAILPGPVATRIFEESKANPDPVSAYHREVMRSMLEKEGMTGYQAAQQILPQIAAGEFWVSTHPEITRGYAANRADVLANLHKPVLADELKAMLGIE